MLLEISIKVVDVSFMSKATRIFLLQWQGRLLILLLLLTVLPSDLGNYSRTKLLNGTDFFTFIA